MRKTCKYKYRLDANVCNSKQSWNEDKCRCECKELIDKGSWDKGFNWNSSTSECECESSDVGEYLDYENCKCRKKIVDKLIGIDAYFVNYKYINHEKTVAKKGSILETTTY